MLPLTLRPAPAATVCLASHRHDCSAKGSDLPCLAITRMLSMLPHAPLLNPATRASLLSLCRPSPLPLASLPPPPLPSAAPLPVPSPGDDPEPTSAVRPRPMAPRAITLRKATQKRENLHTNRKMKTTQVAAMARCCWVVCGQPGTNQAAAEGHSPSVLLLCV